MDRLGVRMPLEFYPQCELKSLLLSPNSDQLQECERFLHLPMTRQHSIAHLILIATVEESPGLGKNGYADYGSGLPSEGWYAL
ncbi:hypothetical protein AVEN_38446-1 [Araneus ventricosus]|uniref:Uncharacterized protein n=1 Tax=Araneus ventricosus TaxID=182803 RepID=A0A4Y2H1G4_ARAVE|nr:hypothetical protein AVEN_38446-1 [Araneus ventricosus]